MCARAFSNNIDCTHYTPFVRLSAAHMPMQEYIRELAICTTVGGPCSKRVRPLLSRELQSPYAHPRRRPQAF